MNEPSDWKDDYSDVIAEGRKRLQPPTADEVEALFDNKLSPADAERVRELLAYYPEMARAMTEPFPADAEGVLTKEEIAADIAAIRKRTGITPAPAPLPFPSRLPTRVFAIAAGLIIVIAAGAFVAALLKFVPETGSAVTRVVYPTEIPTRGGPVSRPPILLTKGHNYRLKLVFTPPHDYHEYRLAFFDLGSTPSRSLWTRDHVLREKPGVYPVRLSTKRLSPGRYELILYGLDEGEADRLATFAIRVSS